MGEKYMKKLILLLIIALMFSTAAFADHAEDSLALGGTSGIGLGWNGLIYADFYPASLSLKIPKVPVFWGLSVKPFRGFGLGITGDWYFWEPNLVEGTRTNEDGSYELKIDWYVGAGFYANMYMGKDYLGGDGGLRIPFGVSWHAMQQIRQLEVCVGSVAGLGIGGNKYLDKPYFHWFVVPVEITVRWWFGG